MPTVPSPPREYPYSTVEHAPHAPRTSPENRASHAAREDGTWDKRDMIWPPLTRRQDGQRNASVPLPPAPHISTLHALPRNQDAVAEAAHRAIAALCEPRDANAQAQLAYVMDYFDTPAVQAAIDAVAPGSPAESRLIAALTNLLCLMSAEDPEDCDDLPCAPVALYLLRRCTWDAICEPRLFDCLQRLMRGPVTMALIDAEARDAAIARAAAPYIFAGTTNPAALMEKLLQLRRTKLWDSILQAQSPAILGEAIATGEFERVEQLLTYAPQSSAEAAARILFEAVGPGDTILPALRAFCAKHQLTMPQTLQPPPVPMSHDYLDALLQRVVQRGFVPADMRYFWSALDCCDADLRERLLRADLDRETGGELVMLFRASPSDRVTRAFAPALLGRLMKVYADNFQCPLLGFGVAFAVSLVETLPAEEVDALVAMKEFLVVRDLLELGQWEPLGTILLHVGPATRDRVFELLHAPAPPRDQRFATRSAPPSADDLSEALEDDELEQPSRMIGNPAAMSPPVAYI